MFNVVSKGGLGSLTLVVEALLKLFGVDAPEGTVGNAIEGLFQFVALVLLVTSQFQRKDLIAGIVRKFKR